MKNVKKGEKGVTLFETKLKVYQKRDKAWKFGMAVALKRYNVEL